MIYDFNLLYFAYTKIKVLQLHVFPFVWNRSHLENQYSAKRSAMEMKKSEMMRISQDFESKLRQNEVSENLG